MRNHVTQIVLKGLHKRYAAGVVAVDDVDMSIEPGEFVVILGPSGSGKSTLLRMIAGLETADSGNIRIGGGDVTRVPAHRRGVAMVFQNPALYPHLNVFENLAFGLRAEGVKRTERKQRVGEIADILRLRPVLDRRPSALSGGEKQRAALGRAIVRRPRVLLLDEPFSSLDLPLRSSLRNELIGLHEQLRTTIVHVTHDQGEALALGQRVAVLHQGKFVQFAPPRRLYHQPANRFVGTFVGTPAMNLLPGELVDATSGPIFRLLESHGPQLESTAEQCPALYALRGCVSPRIDLGIRPEFVSLLPDSAGADERNASPCFAAKIHRIEFLGQSYAFELHIGQIRLISVQPTDEGFREGQTVMVSIDLGHAFFFDHLSGQLLERPRD
jgi:multiple sugar transport system ATP-binding protein